MKFLNGIKFTTIALLMVLGCWSCDAEKDDNFRVVDYSYVLQNNTDRGPEFAFYMYAFSYVRGPVADLYVSGSTMLETAPVTSDLYESVPVFGGLDRAADSYSYTASNQRGQSVEGFITHNITEDMILGHIDVMSIDLEGRNLLIEIANVENANYYGFFLIPGILNQEGEIVYPRAMAGRPFTQVAVDNYYDRETNRDHATESQIVIADIDLTKYEHSFKIVPLAMHETPDGSRLIVESNTYLIIDIERSADSQ